ncbi:PLP-dependent aminotransferase family protein [Aquibacillus koreensis]|uniref:PLP-dependent aminotransferase family protein n=1 Tax=Aquibacillus koreensis TaxID=279446 RepID=A0A9X4AJR1_9BACI|nr:PLP-dependent aminotransferase family protein [Aquibacillus koreensis]MCT2536154.1 PLP-dependent aminotransferase family protein [Aquibacillus koreensis]MDC3422079.1 PLP-dependent aminotransferase family protein [Aquibacillus koreensis]
MKYGFSHRVRYMKSSAVRDILKVVNKGNVISFAGGLPDENLFPVEAVQQAFQSAIASGNKVLQYGETEGVLELRERLAERMAKKGIHRNPENILVTSGSQQAIDLFARVMFNPGDIILTENPTYLAALQVFESYETKIVAVDSDDDGMLEEDLEDKIARLKPKCIYVVPTYSNPGGKVWSLERRKKLLALAKKYHVVIFEDDPYGEIQFDKAPAPPSIASMDNNKLVLYTSTFSKTVVPAMRIGWIVGPHQIIRLMAQAKQATDLHTNSISQHALIHLMKDFDLDGHIQNLRDTYFQRMHVMKGLLDKVESEELSYITPKGGMFFWVNMPKEINTSELLKVAVDNGVAFVPGAPFYVSDPEQNTMRLNFTNASPEQIEIGMERLVSVINAHQYEPVM